MALDLPFFERYKAIFADKLNRIVSELRASTIQPGIGYKVNRTPGGTTLVIDQQAGGGGATASADYCFFKVSDVTDPQETVLKVSIQADQVEDRWPDGMDGTAPLELELDDTLGDWIAIYLLLKVDEYGIILPESTAISFKQKNEFQKEGSSLQWFYIAGVSISTDTEGKKYISRIDNTCPVVYAWAPSPCPFEVEDATDVLGTPQILVRSGTIEQQLPEGMYHNTHYVQPLPADGDWFAIYSKIAIKDGAIDYTQNPYISITIENEYKESTDSIQWDILSEVSVSTNAESQRYISFIKNYCYEPKLQTTTTDACSWRVTDYSSGGTIMVRIQAKQVQDTWPTGAETGEYYITLDHQQSQWYAIYLKVVVDEYGSIFPDLLQIVERTSYPMDGDVIQWFLLAGVTISYDTEGQPYISALENYCPTIVPRQSYCAFEINNASENGQPRIQVRVGKIEQQYPSEMESGVAFYKEVPTSQEWWAVYSRIKTKYGYVDNSAEDPITITLEEEYRTSDDSRQWDLLGELTVHETDNGGQEVDWISNYCVQPRLPIYRPTACDFQLYNASDSEGQKIRIRNSMIVGAYPDGMSADTEYVITIEDTSATNYFYAVIRYDTTNMVISSDTDARSLGNYIELQTNNVDTLYILIGTVKFEANKIKSIESYCNPVVPNPCLLDWSQVNQ
jgi:hypothetical protein